jgi:3-deoxy-manno-octulosonate cytidylyltransferase (CMP-KDO synthetase)
MHLGVYAYQIDFLKKFTTLSPGILEQTEKLEQLRVLENGYTIIAGIVEQAMPGIDTLEDYQQFVARWTRNPDNLP